jgi:hypothetical protein
MDTDTLDIVESLTPLQALQEFLAAAAEAGVETDELNVIQLTSLGGTLTRIDVALELVPEDLSTWTFGGVTSLTYNRIDLADFFSGINLHFIPPSYPTTTAWLCQQIATVGQIDFDASDFVQETIDEAMALSYTLKADPNSLRWVGQVSVAMFRQQQLAAIFLNAQGQPVNNMGSLLSITQDMGIGMQSYYTNGTIAVKQLLNMPAGYVFTLPEAVMPANWDFMNQMVNKAPWTWVIDGSGPKAFNGYGAKVLYNGPVIAGYDTPYNPNLTQVCRIQINPNYCTNTDGVLSIYYSLARLEN